MQSRGRQIIAFPKDGNLYTELLYAQVEKRGVSVIEGHWSTRWLAKHVRRGDLLHIHWPSFFYDDPDSRSNTGLRLATMYARLAFAKARGATIVWTAHNLYPHDGGDQWLHRVGRTIIVHFADIVIAHGPSAAAVTTEVLKVLPSRLRIGHHPHWMDQYANTATRAESRARLNIGAGEFLYLHIGRCRPYKGLESLIEAFPGTGESSRLLIAGKFSSPQYLEAIRALAQGTPRIDLVTRSIENDEMQWYLNAADCVVLPYRAVLTSGTALLALSFGRPVIAPDLGAMRDHVDASSGILYEPGKPLALAQALEDIRSRVYDPAAIMRQASRFTWSGLADLLLAVLDRS